MLIASLLFAEGGGRILAVERTGIDSQEVSEEADGTAIEETAEEIPALQSEQQDKDPAEQAEEDPADTLYVQENDFGEPDENLPLLPDFEIEDPEESGFLPTEQPSSGGMSARRFLAGDGRLRGEEVPASYDARDVGHVSSVRNQNPWGVCWAFQATSAAESALLIAGKGETDLSEVQLVEFAYNGERGDGGVETKIPILSARGNTAGDYTRAIGTKQNLGGNGIESMFALARWTGLGEESLCNEMNYAYNMAAGGTDLAPIPVEYAFADTVHLQNTYVIPLSDPLAVKQAIQRYGSIGINLYSNAYYDSRNTVSTEAGVTVPCCMYNDTNLSPNHAVSVVGWDDAYPIDNFKFTTQNVNLIAAGKEPKLPTQPGAWLVKNSYGTDWGSEDGYVWVSYENRSFSNTASRVASHVFAFDFEDADHYDQIYQYDGTIGTNSYSVKYVAAEYTVTDGTGEKLDAVGIGLASADVTYEVTVYRDLADPTDPTSGTVASVTAGTLKFAGYHTIPLEDPVWLAPEETVSVVYSLSDKNGGTVSVYGDRSYESKNTSGQVVQICTSEVHAGETFYRTSPTKKWTDTVNWSTPTTFRLKAYTTYWPIDLTEMEIAEACEEEAKIYDAVAWEPELNLIAKNARLQKDVHYTADYLPIGETGAVQTENATAQILHAGTYAVRITGIAPGCTGSRILDTRVTMLPRAIEGATAVTQNLSFGATDDPIREVYLMLNASKIILERESDYMLTWYDSAGQSVGAPVNAGRYRGVMEGVGNYTGSIEKTITVSGVNLKNVSIGKIAAQTYRGGLPLCPEPALTYRGRRLTKDEDYTLSYQKNRNVGTGKVIITGTGRFTGSRSVGFAIRPLQYAEGGKLTITTEATAPYTKRGAEAKTEVIYRDMDGETPYEVLLEEGKDYIVKASYNTAVTTEKTGNKPRQKIEFCGNYAGTSAAIRYEIVRADVNDEIATVEISDKVYSKKKASWKSVPVVKDQNGKTLSVGFGNQDLFASYLYKNDTDLGAEVREAGSPVQDSDRVPIGTEITVLLGGINAYYGQYEAAEPLGYRVTGGSVANATYKTETVIFPVELSEAGVTIEAGTTRIYLNKKRLSPETDYEIVAGSYRNNRKVGTASVLIRGKGDYGGTKRVKFRIRPLSVAGNFDITIGDGTSVPYRKGGVMPKVSVTNRQNGAELVSGRDYTCSFGNHRAVTTETTLLQPYVKIKGIGNYSGTLRKTFVISRRDLTEMLVQGGSANAQDRKYSSKRNAWKSAPILTDTNGKALKKNHNYTIAYQYGKDTVISGKLYKTGEPVEVRVLPIGTVVRCVIQGTGAYAGEISCTYRIIK